jgi:hypothetical protein
VPVLLRALRRRAAGRSRLVVPDAYESGIARVGKDFSGYVAFWKEVRVEE